ncbi:sigma-54-dependent transcriptional regulator [Gimesia maris]|uniref:DNA-binding transcriptional regulator NtrC n=1 Tax=Gimesia maris TaxID=122 RepID=A0ABX5YFI1_9PLAN|nr:sigma-54 dependent transcriptional regulator [Gimesia maris]EDL59087.1 nitrogen regulation protein NR(I) [Gimesia maris DSM 8797]QEG14468.1 Nitrogen regulation protein NR(I) [Gimesia maris]QGQ32106.1 sigma-54-dependent Fis family transcriptional regulator [Gimesia maris]
MSKLLIVDDEESICWGLSQLGESLGHQVRMASSAEQALTFAEEERPDVVVMDVRLPGIDGLTAMQGLYDRIGTVPVIVITAYGDLQTAVEAVRKGAFDYIVKPFDLNQMERVLEKAIDESQRDVLMPGEPKQVEGLVGSTPEMQNVFKSIALVAGSEASVLLSGESGTGKELAAQAIHRFSDRSEGPFVAVNIASLSEGLAESELFGHAQGAFTSADSARVGFLEQADQGTLFLDEVADIPLAIQIKLLRALEEGEVLPVGSNQRVKTSFRVIAATHRNLESLIKQGKFRHDLYFRLCTFQIDIPPLRKRVTDIRVLAEFFLERFVDRQTGMQHRLTAETVAELERRPWYGNVRELRNAIEHAALRARGGTILPEDLPAAVSQSFLGMGEAPAGSEAEISMLLKQWAEAQLTDPEQAANVYEQLLALIEPPVMEVALEKFHGQCAPAARCLGLHRTTLSKKLKQYGIENS